jgi:hypothetical protein
VRSWLSVTRAWNIELAVQLGRSDLLVRLAAQASVEAALLPWVIGPWIITVTTEQVRMRRGVGAQTAEHISPSESIRAGAWSTAACGRPGR